MTGCAPQKEAGSSSQAAPAIEVAGICQTYPGVQAVTDLSMTLSAAEVVGLVGHNGAGKSTLTRIIGGVERPARGRLLVQGREVEFHAPQDAIAAGISVVPQALSVVPTLTVGENIALGMRLQRLSLLRSDRGGLRKAALDQRIEMIAAQLGIADNLRTRAAACAPSIQRLMMVARALVHRPAVMLLDEPTAALRPEEAERVFAAVEALRSEGMAIMFISHRLDEVLKISSRVIVMRQGRVVAQAPSSALSTSQLGELIVGHELDKERAVDGTSKPQLEVAAEVILRCDRIAVHPVVSDVSLNVARGEVVGLAGLEGSGCSEVLRAIAGLARLSKGTVTICDRPLHPTRRAAIDAGVAYLPNDRVHNGIVPEMTVAATVTLSDDRQFRVRRWLPLVRLKREAMIVERSLDKLDLHPRAAARKKIKLLSGGNQQKALMARALVAGADLYLFDEPTEGVDVGAKEELHRHIRDLARQGGAVVVTSSEPEELADLCDRVIVLFGGRVVHEFEAGQISEAMIVHAALVGQRADVQP